MHPKDFSGEKTVVTDKQDLPDYCLTMLINEQLCSQAQKWWGTLNSFLGPFKVIIAFMLQTVVAQSHTVSFKLLQNIDVNSSKRTPIHFDVFLEGTQPTWRLQEVNKFHQRL